MNKKIKLTGSQLNDLVKESVTRILKEGSSNEDDERKWYFLTDELGANEFINNIYNNDYYKYNRFLFKYCL